MNSSSFHPGYLLNITFSLSTLYREYAALAALEYYDLCDTIFRPRLAPMERLSPNEVSRAMTSYRVNEPQAKAILSSLNTTGFSLIQGYVARPYHIGQ